MTSPTPDAICERLWEPLDCEQSLQAWSKWRKYIAERRTASWPRDAFERLLSAADDERSEAADLIQQQQATIERLNAALRHSETLILPMENCALRNEALDTIRAALGKDAK